MLGFVIILAFAIYISYNLSIQTSILYPSKDKLLIHYIDVDQGDAALIQFNNKNLLIDAGPENKKVLSYLKRQGIKKLDYVVATHPHDDHIGNMSYIIKNFNVDKFLAPKITNNTDAFKV